MATNRRPAQAEDEDEIPQPQPRGKATIQDMIAAFTMLDGMAGKTQAEKSTRLKLIGFSNREIATMLETTAAVVATNLYSEKKKAAKKARAKKPSPAEV
jgi:hypothetical protein